MNKKFTIISLICLTIVGALFTMLGSNMFFADISNIAVGFARSTILITIPAAIMAVMFALGIFYVIRAYKHPNCLKSINRLYLIIAIALNVVALSANIAGAFMVYGTLVSLSPFPGYTIIFMVLELAIIGGAIFGLVKNNKRPDDEGKVKITFVYVLKTIGWFMFIMLMLNRLGTLLGAPFYAYARNLYETFPFYLYLLVPTYIGALVVLTSFKMIDKKKALLLTYISIGVNVVLFAYIALMGINDTGFISSLSEAMPLERLASKPLEMLIHFVAYLGVGAALLVLNLKNEKAEQINKKDLFFSRSDLY